MEHENCKLNFYALYFCDFCMLHTVCFKNYLSLHANHGSFVAVFCDSVIWRRDTNILVRNPQHDFEKFIISFFFFWPGDIFYFEACLIQVQITVLRTFQPFKLIFKKLAPTWKKI